MLAARISLTLSRHSSLSFIALGRSSGQHPVSSHSCWMYVRAGRPAFARPCVGIHKSTSLMSSSLLLQQCPACLVRLTWIDFVIGGRWPYSWCLVGCRCQVETWTNTYYGLVVIFRSLFKEERLHTENVRILLNISLFLTENNPLLSGQISNKTWYTWQCLTLTINSDGHRKKQLPYHHLSNLYLFASLLFFYQYDFWGL